MTEVLAAADAGARDATGPARFEGRAMGSPLRLTLGHGATDRAGAARCWMVVVDEFEAAEAAMSRFRDDSELTALNRRAGSGQVVHPSVRLRHALVAADRAHRVTAGRFDPRVLADLDRLGYRGAPIGTDTTLPDARGHGPGGARGHGADDAHAHARPHVAGPIVERVGRDGIVAGRPIDLGGIGKGLTLRWAAARLVEGGTKDLLLEAGGDLVALGRSPGGGPWSLGIEDPAGSGDPLAVIVVADLAVATSSTRVHRWATDGRTVHHLLDPRTGEPAESGLTAVTVAGTDPAWAEVWSKVLFLGGRSAITGEARSRGLAAWWVADDGSLEMTAAARALTVWVAAEAGV